MPQHQNGKRYWSVDSFEPACQSPWTWPAANSQHSSHILVFDLTAKIEFVSLDSGFLCDFNTTLLQMWQKLFSLFLQERDMLHTRKILLKHREIVFCNGTTLRVEGGIRLRFWGMGPQHTVEPRSIIFQGDGENRRWMRENDQSGKLLFKQKKVVHCLLLLGRILPQLKIWLFET
jgi:hypothetical protein